MTSVSGCEFSAAVCYALSQLRTPHLSLKEQQRRSIRAIFDGKDVFVCLPTGFGKSLCFQTLPFVFDHKLGFQRKSAVVVVSPLVALMTDQVQSLRKKGIDAVVISSDRRGEAVADDFVACESSLKTASLIFCSPEALVQTKWRETMEKPGVSDRVCAIVVDEAHCISKW